MSAHRFAPELFHFVRCCGVTATIALAVVGCLALGAHPALAQPNLTGRWTQPTDPGRIGGTTRSISR